MANIRLRKISIDRFFEFASGVLPFDLIDIVSESETYGVHIDSKTDEFEYRTHFFINQQVSEELGATGLRVEVFVTDPRERKPSSTDAVASFEVKFDIAANILEKKGETQTKSVITRVPPAIFKKVLVAANRLPPKIPRLIIPGRQRTPTPSFRSVSKMLKTSGADPAALAATGNFFATTPKTAISLDSDNARPNDRSRARSSGSNIRRRSSLAATRSISRSKRRGPQSNELVRTIEPPTTADTQSNTAYISFLPTKREFVQDFSINNELVHGSEKLYATISVIPGSETNVLFETKIVEIQHGRELSEFLANPEPPILSLVSSGPAKIKVKIQRTDPSLRVVRVFRIITNPNAANTSLENIADLTFAKDNTLIFDDFVDNASPNKVLYRIAVVNGDGSIGEFSSLPIPSFKKISDPLNTAAVPVSIRAINKLGAAHIRVTTLSDDIYTIRLLRQEFDKIGSFSDSVTVIPSDSDDNLTLVNGVIDSFEFRDSTAILGKKYRYFVAYRIGQPGYASLGEEILSDEDELLIRRYVTTDIPFIVSVTDATVSQDADNNTTVSFDIQSKETTDLFRAVISSLRAAGVGNEFISALQKDDIKAKLFTMFLVERFEFSSGRRDTFGIYPAGNFSDSSTTRLARKIPPPRSGERYEYIVKTCLQQPEVFLQTSNVGLINRYGDEIKRKGARFSRLVYDKLGVMPSDRDVLGGKSIEGLLLEAQVGQENSVYARIPKTSPTIESFQVTKKSFYSTLTWRAAGDTKNISYFLVYCSHNGANQLLGAIAASDSSSLYRFRDDTFFDEVGEKAYSIRAISFDDDEMAGSVSVSTDTPFSIPANSMQDFLQGASPDFSKLQELVGGLDSQFDSSTSEKPFDWSQVDQPNFSGEAREEDGKKDPGAGFISANSSSTSGQGKKTHFFSFVSLDANQEIFDVDEKSQILKKGSFF